MNGNNTSFTGVGHTNQITDMCVMGSKLLTASMDGTVRITELSTQEYGPQINLEEPVTSIDYAKNGSFFVAVTAKNINVIAGAGAPAVTPAAWSPNAVAVSVDGKIVAVGGKDDKKIHLFSVNGVALTEIGVFSYFFSKTSFTLFYLIIFLPQ